MDELSKIKGMAQSYIERYNDMIFQSADGKGSDILLSSALIDCFVNGYLTAYEKCTEERLADMRDISKSLIEKIKEK